jgi:hypothetical protein
VAKPSDRTSPDRQIPVGTIERIRVRAGGAVALFAASVPPAVVGAGLISTASDKANIATPFAFLFWAAGLALALAAAVPTIRHWEGLPPHIRWFGALPLLCVSLFLSVAVIGVTLRG